MLSMKEEIQVVIDTLISDTPSMKRFIELSYTIEGSDEVVIDLELASDGSECTTDIKDRRRILHKTMFTLRKIMVSHNATWNCVLYLQEDGTPYMVRVEGGGYVQENVTDLKPFKMDLDKTHHLTRVVETMMAKLGNGIKCTVTFGVKQRAVEVSINRHLAGGIITDRDKIELMTKAVKGLEFAMAHFSKTTDGVYDINFYTEATR